MALAMYPAVWTLGEITEAEGIESLKRMDTTEDILLAALPLVLSNKQMKRFEELSCQMSGPMALRLQHYSVRLQLSEAQRARIANLVDIYSDKVRPLQRVAFSTGSADNTTKLKAMACELDEKILALLTESQRMKWTDCLGKRFDWSGITE